MGTLNGSKLNQLFQEWPRNQVVTSESLHRSHIGNDLIKRYVKSGWLKRIGTGAFLRVGDELNWYSAVEAVQSQLEIPIHVGGETALKLHGIMDQVEKLKSGSTLHIYSHEKSKLPRWFTQADLDVKIKFHQDELFQSLPANSISKYEIDHRSILISCRERAILEFLNEVPNRIDFDSVKAIFVQLGTIRSKVIQEHLEKCNSIKVNRLFLYLARESNHAWYAKLNKKAIQLGTGKREIVKAGVLDSEYLITVPKRDDANQ